jgi:uncharacterized protein (DUF1501 family)
MRVDRRTFLKVAASAGLSAAAPLWPSRAFGAVDPYEGPFYVMITAAGGWDPIFLTDPKAEPDLNRHTTDIGRAGEITFAPNPVDPIDLGLDPAFEADYRAHLMSNQAFFEKHGPRLLVLNGVDTSTNNHEAGSRSIWSGRIPGGYPAFGALVAAAKAPEAPMPFVSAGGFDATANVVPLVRIRNVNALRNAAFPERLNAADPASPTYHRPATTARIRRYRAERLAAQRAKQNLPRIKGAMGRLELARGADDVLSSLIIPESLVEVPGNQLNDLQGMMQQTQLAFAAFRSGLAVSANLAIGGFDTHGNHDRDQVRQIAKILKGVDYVWEEAERSGLADKVVVVVGSDFGRGPAYNGGNPNSGKDHWPVTSVLLMGQGIRGGRMVGGTDESVRARAIDPSSLALSDGGVKLAPGHLHHSLRHLSGVDETEVGARFPLPGQRLPLLQG